MRQAYHYWQDQPDSCEDSARPLRPTDACLSQAFFPGLSWAARRAHVGFLVAGRDARRPSRLALAGRAGRLHFRSRFPIDSTVLTRLVGGRPQRCAMLSQHDRSAWPTDAFIRRSLDRPSHISLVMRTRILSKNISVSDRRPIASGQARSIGGATASANAGARDLHRAPPLFFNSFIFTYLFIFFFWGGGGSSLHHYSDLETQSPTGPGTKKEVGRGRVLAGRHARAGLRRGEQPAAAVSFAHRPLTASSQSYARLRG